MASMTRKVTEFEARVYRVLADIPEGRVTTYAAVARRLGVGASQAVGQALRRNPFAPVVPCHRVIRSDLTLGGYSGAMIGGQLERKRELLASEGVLFDEDGRLCEPERFWE